MVEISRSKDLDGFQKKVRVKWKNIKFLDQALTHSSCAKSNSKKISDNERMEFLGDSVLELVIADYLFCKFPHLNEGSLSRMRSIVVSEESLAYHARKINLGRYILVGKDQDQICSQDATLADAYEAVIGALYLDQGLKTARRFILDFFIKEENLLGKSRDFKSLLQEYSQSVHKKLPHYQLVQEEGPDHKKMFRIKVKINGKILGEGWGPSKKKAEKIAAKKAWEKLDTINLKKNETKS